MTTSCERNTGDAEAEGNFIGDDRSVSVGVCTACAYMMHCSFLTCVLEPTALTCAAK